MLMLCDACLLRRPVLHPVFSLALEGLPAFTDCNVTIKLDKCDEPYKKYMDFLGAYGTAHIDSVNMGAKRIHRRPRTPRS